MTLAARIATTACIAAALLAACASTVDATRATSAPGRVREAWVR